MPARPQVEQEEFEMIKQYEKKDGTKAWLFKLYLGINESTGKKMWTTRRGFKTKKACQLAQNRLIVDVQENGFQKQRTDTFQEVYDLWFEQYKDTVRESTWCKTEEMFRLHILPQFGSKKLASVKVLFCQKTLNEWFKTVPSRYTHLKSYAAKVFEYGITLEIITKNPMKSTTNPIEKKEYVEDNKLNFYSKEELKTFLSYTKELKNPMAHVFFYLLAFSGMRKGEALALQWKDINLEDNTVSINKTLTRGAKGRLIIVPPKTKKSARTISLDPQTIVVLKQWRSNQRIDSMKFGYNTLQPDQLLFPNTSNALMQPSRSRKWLNSIYNKHSNLKQITTHGLRHTHCSLLFESGASLKEVQERLGHTDIKVTMNIYAHVTQKKKDETAMKFADFMEM